MYDWKIAVALGIPLFAGVYGAGWWLLARHESWAFIALDDRMGGAVVARLDDRKAGYVVVGEHVDIDAARAEATARNERLGIDYAHVDYVTAESHKRGPWEERPFTRD